jgi:hypothetical protein
MYENIFHLTLLILIGYFELCNSSAQSDYYPVQKVSDFIFSRKKPVMAGWQM